LGSASHTPQLFPTTGNAFFHRLTRWNENAVGESGLQLVAEGKLFCHSLAASVGAIVAFVFCMIVNMVTILVTVAVRTGALFVPATNKDGLLDLFAGV
jgi:hypothetical protein